MSDQITVLVYSDDRTVRERVRLALGTRVAADLPPLQIVECATQPAVLKAMDAGGIQLAIFDGEATPAGGIGLCHQVKDEIQNCPPIVLLAARPADSWLAAWCRADAVSGYPIDPVRLPDTVATVLRRTLTPTA